LPIKKLLKKSLGSKLPRVVRDISDVDDLSENHVALFYGKAGRGKTKTAASYPKPLLLLDINNERGTKTVKTVKGLRIARITTWDDFIDLYWWLREGQDYKSVVLDQITGLQDLGMTMIRDKHGKSDDDLFTQKNWGELSGELKTWLQNYRELSDLYNIVFLAHERIFDEDQDAEASDLSPSVGARVMPSVGSFIDGACDIIGQSFVHMRKIKEGGKTVHNPQYCMRIGPHPSYITKIRRPPEAGPLPQYIVNPSYQKLVAIENGTEGSQPSKLKRRK